MFLIVSLSVSSISLALLPSTAAAALFSASSYARFSERHTCVVVVEALAGTS